jgi:hypothetical protein
MNTGSPLAKDHKVKKEPTSEKIKKEKPKISLATAKKLLKPSKRIIGTAETKWLNDYVENIVRGECLPLNLLSNDIFSETLKTFGAGEGAEKFTARILKAFESVP